MRKLFLILASVFLFQSCYTFRTSDITPDKMVVGESYKIQRNSKYEKVSITKITDSSAIVAKGFQEKHIKLSEITAIKTRKFSIVKTAVLPIAIVGTLVGLEVLAWQ